MRLICTEFGIDHEFKENNITELIIESSAIFSSFVVRLLNQFNGDDDFVILSDSEKELRLDKTAEIITDPVNIDINNRKILNGIYQEMIYEVRNNNPERMMVLQSTIEKFIIDVCDLVDYPVSYDPPSSYTDILKLYNVHVDSKVSDLASRIVSYVKISHRLLGKTLFIFVNLKAYISKDSLEELYKSFCYEKINILMIERYDLNINGKEDRIIIDKDACLIYDHF